MRLLLISVLLAKSATVASAQPGLVAPVPGFVPYAAPPTLLALSPDDLEVLERGPISDATHIVGVLTAVSFGFGVGQMVESRWTKTGWIFTLGETAAVVSMVAGLAGSLGDGPCYDACQPRSHSGAAGLLIGGLITFTGLHIWEIADSVVAPINHNNRFTTLSLQMQYPGIAARLSPYVVPAAHGDGAVAGLSLRF